MKGAIIMHKKCVIVVMLLLSVVLIGGCKSDVSKSADPPEHKVTTQQVEMGQNTSSEIDEVVQQDTDTSDISDKPTDTAVKNQPFYYNYMELVDTGTKGSYLLELMDQDGNLVWKRQWDDLEYTELNLGGEPVRSDDKIFIGVYGDLYALDFMTGDVLWKAEGTGSTIKPLVVDDIVYMAGYYGPMLSAVNVQTGQVLWVKEEPENFSWPLKIVNNNNTILVLCSEFKNDSEIEAICKYDLDGNYVGSDNYTGDLWPSQYWDTVMASSTLEPNTQKYVAENCYDANFETAWVEGVSGYGLAEWIELSAITSQDVGYISIANGYQKSFETYEENGKLAKYRVDFSDGRYFIADAKYAFEPFSQEHIQLVDPIKTNTVRITILDILPGTKYEDTCISEVRTIGVD